jgi:hypothetical protein
VNSDDLTPRTFSITARPTRDEKQRFVDLAASRGISESALALIAIRALLESSGSHTGTETAEPGGSRQPIGSPFVSDQVTDALSISGPHSAAFDPQRTSPRSSEPTSQQAHL